MIKLIASDMDGTLVNSKKELPENIFEIINKLDEHNVTFVVASGRQYYNLLSLFDKVKDKVIFIAENGGLIFKNEEKLHIDCMSKDEIKDILYDISSVKHIHPILCGEKAAYYVADNDYFVENAHLYFDRYQYVDNIYDAIELDNICKIAIFDTTDAETNCYPAVSHLSDNYLVTLSGNSWVDICNYSTNKGNAIQIIQDKLNITKDETMAFGDYMNDAEMMQFSQYSYAMANAHPELKKLCNYEAPSNDDNGVVRVICSKLKL